MSQSLGKIMRWKKMLGESLTFEKLNPGQSNMTPLASEASKMSHIHADICSALPRFMLLFLKCSYCILLLGVSYKECCCRCLTHYMDKNIGLHFLACEFRCFQSYGLSCIK